MFGNKIAVVSMRVHAHVCFCDNTSWTALWACREVCDLCARLVVCLFISVWHVDIYMYLYWVPSLSDTAASPACGPRDDERGAVRGWYALTHQESIIVVCGWYEDMQDCRRCFSNARLPLEDLSLVFCEQTVWANFLLQYIAWTSTITDTHHLEKCCCYGRKLLQNVDDFSIFLNYIQSRWWA